MRRPLCTSICLVLTCFFTGACTTAKAAEPAKGRDAAIVAIKELGGRVTNARGMHQVLLEGPKFTDASLSDVVAVGDVESVRLIKTSVTDSGLGKLKELKNLTEFEYLGPRAPDRLTDAGLTHLAAITSLRALSLAETDVTEAGTQHLKGLTNLQSLAIMRSPVTDEALKHLEGLTNLVSLNLASTKVTDAGLEHLKGLTTLEYLDLYDTPITDAGLEHLKGLTNLKRLEIKRTGVTEAGMQKFRQALPQCEIWYSPRT
jgi:hypothetical protein